MTTSQRTGLTGDVEQLLEAVSAGRLDVAAALEQLAQLPFRDLGFARVDTHRELRQGAPRRCWPRARRRRDRADRGGAARRRRRERARDASRCGQAAAVLRRRRGAEEHEPRALRVDRARAAARSAATSWTCRRGPRTARRVQEARMRAELLGTRVTVHEDAGVAGLHRLAPAPRRPAAGRLRDRRRRHGRRARLGRRRPHAGAGDRRPDVDRLRLAFGGVSALLAMLNSCAAGLAVVNIDDGFGAGTIAARIARAAAARTRRDPVRRLRGGVAGDMLLGALLDAGADERRAARAAAGSPRDGLERVTRGGARTASRRPRGAAPRRARAPDVAATSAP